MTSRCPGDKGMMSRKATHNGVLSTTKAEGETSSWFDDGEEEAGKCAPMLQKGQPSGLAMAYACGQLHNGRG